MMESRLTLLVTKTPAPFGDHLVRLVEKLGARVKLASLDGKQRALGPEPGPGDHAEQVQLEVGCVSTNVSVTADCAAKRAASSRPLKHRDRAGSQPRARAVLLALIGVVGWLAKRWRKKRS